MSLSDTEILEIQKRYEHLLNYSSEDVEEPIDPLTYVDSNGDGLMHIAASDGDLRTVELLLKAGLDVNQLGDMGCTPLHCAKMNRHEDVARLLINSGASTTIRNEFGQFPSS